MSTPWLPPDTDEWCCVHCERAGRRLHPVAGVPSWEFPGGAAYLEEKAKLVLVTRDGEIDPRRLHGPELARWQAAEARSARTPALERWLAAEPSSPPGCA